MKIYSMEAERANALLTVTGGGVKSFDEYTATICLIDGREYRVLTDSEAAAEAEEYIKESLWAFNSKFLLEHMESVEYTPEVEKALQETQNKLCESANPLILAMIGGEDNIDCLTYDVIAVDGRGHYISWYDGEEIEQDDFYIYRMN